MAPEESDDVGAVARLAEIFAARELIDEAVAEWERIVAMSPGASDARMRLAAAMVERDDGAGAKAMLAGLVEGERALPENFLTLAGQQSKLDWESEAGATLVDGLALFPDDYDLLSAAFRRETEREGGNPGDLFGRTWRAAPNQFFADDVVRRQVAWLEASGLAEEALAQLGKKTAGGLADLVEATLAFQLGVARQDEAAAREALKALGEMDEPVRMARAEADAAAAFGSLEDQIEAQRAVAAADPRFAVASLQAVARLQGDLGRIDEALETVEEVIAKSPGDASLYGLYADLASASGRFDAAVERLREAIRVVDDGTTLRLQVVDLLVSQARFDEAAETLQDAFEREESEGRRMAIFRRQIEVAMASGRVEDLIAKLRERQAREEGGARYGTYLAEIFILQNDFVSAREELAKSLGSNPDDPVAIQKMMDLAERGGDQAESLRLAARLAEVAPSDANRAEYLERLLESGEVAGARSMLAEVRAEVVRDPGTWAGVLAAMRNARLEEEYDKLVKDISLAAGSGAASRVALAKLQLSQGEIERAKETLWSVVDEGGTKEAITTVLDASPASGSPFFQANRLQLKMQGLQRLAATLQNDLSQLLSSRGGSRRIFHHGMMPGAVPGTVDAEMNARVSALLLLNQMAQAEDRRDAYQVRLREMLRADGVPVADRASILMTVMDEEGLAELVREQADAAVPDEEADKLLVSIIPSPAKGLAEPMERIRARREAKDPGLQFGRLLNELGEKFSEESTVPTVVVAEGETRDELRGRVEELRNHPGLGESNGGESQLAMLAARAGDFEMAFELLDDAEARDDVKGSGGAMQGFLLQNRLRTHGTLVAMMILAGDPLAKKKFEQFANDTASLMAGGQFGRMNFGPGYQQVSPLAQSGKELVIGAEAFPYGIFTTWMQMAKAGGEEEKLRDWFADNSDETELDAYAAAVAYGDWVEGDQEAAVAAIESIHAQDPTGQTAAFLLELNERSDQPERALELIDEADLQLTETAEVRSLRRLRLLNAAGQGEEARKLGEKLARGRVSAGVRGQLVNELNALGVAPATVARLSNFRSSFSRGRTSRDQMLRDQLEKLVDAGRSDDAERIALAQLGRPLPSNQDYDAINTRSSVLRALGSMDRLDAYATGLREKLADDPGDIDAAIRLAEVEAQKDGTAAAEKLMERLEAHPERVVDLAAALRIAQRSGDSGELQSKMVSAVLAKNPGAFGGGMQVNELMQYANGAEGGARIASALAALDEDAFNRLLFTQRLVMPGAESGMLTQLGGFAAQAGEMNTAVKLLERARDSQLQTNRGGRDFGVDLKLVDILEKAGRTEEAAEVFRGLLVPVESTFGMMRPVQGLANYLAGSVQNQQNSPSGPNAIEDVAKMAEATGTVDLLLETLNEEATSAHSIPVGLLLRSELGRTGSSQEWLDAAEQGGVFLGYAAIPTVGAAISALAAQPDASEVLPKFLGKMPPVFGNSSGDVGLRVLVQTLPLLAEMQGDPALDRYARSILESTLADANAVQYLPNTPHYGTAIRALTQSGLTDLARRLFDVSSSQQTNVNRGNRVQIDLIEANLLAAEGKVDVVEIICVAVPADDPEKVTLRWQIRPTLKSQNRYNEQELTTWDVRAPELAAADCPEELQIFAGANPAALEPVISVSRPNSQGEREVKLPSRLGVLQARWTGTDGSVSSGPLTVYVAAPALEGEPIRENGGAIPVTVPGPLGEQSGLSFSGRSVTSDWQYPLLKNATVDVEDLGVYALIGWVSKDDAYGSAPRVETEWRESDGKTSSEHQVRSRSDLAGRWAQLFEMYAADTSLPSVRDIGDATAKVGVEITLNSGRNYGGSYAIEGSWDGVRLVRLAADEVSGGAEDLLAAARADAKSEAYDAAADAYLAAIRVAPERVFSREARQLVDVFRNADRLDELFAALANPALYLPNPLLNGAATVREPELIQIMAAEAVGDEATPGAKRWLVAMESAPLADSQRYIVGAAVLRERLKVEAAAVQPDQVIALMGFAPDDLNEARLRGFWGNALPTTLSLLDAVAEAGRAEAVLAEVKKLQPPTPYQAGLRLLEAWLVAATDAEAATQLWQQSLTMRRNDNNMSIYDDADRSVIERIAASHAIPGNLIAAVQSFVASTNQNERQRQRRSTEMLFALRKVGKDDAARAVYESAWVDSEIAGLGSPESSVNRERLSEVATALVATEDWGRLERILDLTDSRRSQLGTAVRAEFERLEKLVDFVQGDVSVAWPVAWVGEQVDGKTRLHWQWNLRNVDANGNELEDAITVSEAPLVRAIPNQTKVEFLYGEMPADLRPVAESSGESAEGAVSAVLPTTNGFLRAVASFGDRQVAGPLIPVVSGRRLFGEDLRAILEGGPQGLSTDRLTDAGTSPDGSAALRIDSGGSRRRIGIEGEAVAVKPEKFYVMRSWVRRAGTGTVAIRGEYRAVKEDKMRPLAMNLCDDDGVTGVWTLYTRAIPTYPQHTFWIPFQAVKEIAPKLDNVSDETEIAGLEVYEIDDWAYGRWIGELAMLREEAGDEIDEARLSRAFELAAFEPLTALDYHGFWLVERGLAAGRAEEVVELFEVAVGAEINPLFGKPKHDRVLQALRRLIDAEDSTPRVKLAATRVALLDPDRVGAKMLFGFYGQMVAATRAVFGDDSAEALGALEEFREFVRGRAERNEGGYFADLIGGRDYTNSRPDSEFLNVVASLADEQTVEIVKSALEGKAADRIASGSMMFVALALEIAGNDGSPGADWDERVEAAFTESKEIDSTAERVYWPTLLGDALGGRADGAQARLELRRRVFDDTVAADADDVSDWREVGMAGLALLESARDSEDAAVAERVARELAKAAEVERKGSQSIANGAAGLTLEASRILVEMGMTSEGVELARQAAGKVKRSDDLEAKFRAFLKEASE